MQRRQFLGSSLAASAFALNASAQTGSAAASGRQYYELRKYHLQSGPQEKLTDAYFEQALIPALNRMGMSPIGAFSLYLGPEQPSIYLLIPASSLEALVTTELHLAQDQQFLESAKSFWAAPAKDPAFERLESQLMIAFEGYPKLTLPPATATKANRVFQLRIYESPSQADHVRKIEMFHAGEFDIFAKAGFWNVFFSDTLIGPRLPNLTYMVSFPDLSQMNDMWKAFSSHPDWKKLVSSPKYNFESIVSNISSLILNPKSYSQI